MITIEKTLFPVYTVGILVNSLKLKVDRIKEIDLQLNQYDIEIENNEKDNNVDAYIYMLNNEKWKLIKDVKHLIQQINDTN